MPAQLKKKNFLWNPIIILFSGIVLAGIFFRTYSFHDWLRFNADQSRDAEVVSQVVDGNTPIPLLGPKAGGTVFRLGPAFYHFQIISAKIFGNFPDKMAYPDLFTSILSIPLIFIFLRKNFGNKISLGLTALFAISFYAIKYSRFAWNPNSIPFWTMLFLYSLSAAVIIKEKKKFLWPILAGISFGIAVQLHTLLLVILPILTLGVASFFIWKNKKLWKNFVLIFLIAIFLNVPQIVSENQNKWENTKAFFQGMNIKEDKNSSLLSNIATDTKCFVKGNQYIISSLSDSDDCKIYNSKNKWTLLYAIFGTIFFVGGIMLFVLNFKKEKDQERKYFLGIILSYVVLSFFVMIPVANEISMRFFLMVIFMPFLLLGFWVKFLLEKYGKRGIYIGSSILAILALFNLITIKNEFIAFTNHTTKPGGSFENADLKEVELISQYIISNTNGTKTAFIGGNKQYLFKFEKSIGYFTEKAGIQLAPEKKSETGSNIFRIVATSKNQNILEKSAEEFIALDGQAFGRFSVIKLIKK
jgi:4-amino-4-deoxy-L-arabinose transferase-like glycosyltransferase